MSLYVNNLWVTINGIDIVKGVSLSLNSKEICALIGPNGAGKSTLLKAIAKIIPSRGEVRILGKDLKHYSRNELSKILVYASIDIPRGFKVKLRDLLEASLYNLALPRQKVEERILWIARELDLIPFLDRRLDTLSSGELQRAIIASALIRKPRILLLDEFLAHLDLKRQIEVFRLIHRYTKQNNAITIVVVHNLELAAYFCDCIALMNNGKVIAFGKVSEVLTSENLVKLFEVPIRIKIDESNRYLIYLDIT